MRIHVEIMLNFHNVLYLSGILFSNECCAGTCIRKVNMFIWAQIVGFSYKNSLVEKSLKLCSYLPSQQLGDFDINSSNSHPSCDSLYCFVLLQYAIYWLIVGLFLFLQVRNTWNKAFWTTSVQKKNTEWNFILNPLSANIPWLTCEHPIFYSPFRHT